MNAKQTAVDAYPGESFREIRLVTARSNVGFDRWNNQGPNTSTASPAEPGDFPC